LLTTEIPNSTYEVSTTSTVSSSGTQVASTVSFSLATNDVTGSQTTSAKINTNFAGSSAKMSGKTTVAVVSVTELTSTFVSSISVQVQNSESSTHSMTSAGLQTNSRGSTTILLSALSKTSVREASSPSQQLIQVPSGGVSVQTTNSASTLTPTTTLPTTTFNRLQLLNMSSFFTNNSLNLNLIIGLFANYTGDLSGCLANCSNNGYCSVNTASKVVCTCLNGYSGSSCQTNLRPCSKGPCLNNGTCLEDYDQTSGDFSYNCSCALTYYGVYCQNQIDICANKSCSGNGRCVVNGSLAQCQCFQMYSGDACEIESPAMKTIKGIISTSAVIAILSIVLSYCLLVLSDLHTHFFITKEKAKARAAKMRREKREAERDKQKRVEIRFQYLPHGNN
jgi:hypothetical protein